MSARQRRAKAKRRKHAATRRAVVPVALSGTLATAAALGFTGAEAPSAGAAVTSIAQLQNINHAGAPSNPGGLTQIGGTTFFSAYQPGVGRELWKSDGTAGGTLLVKDIDSGPDSSYPRSLTNVNGTLFFTASDGANGTELWRSDGTAAGTVQIKDILAGRGNGYPVDLTNVGGTLYFTAFDPQTGTELWQSDGTAGGTVEVKDIDPGTAGSYPRNLTNVGGTLYFTATDGTHGFELWRTTGLSDGAVQVKDINPSGSGLGSSYYYGTGKLTNVNGTLYFAANDGSTGTELWKSNGSSDGTVQVQDVNPGSGGSYPRNLTNAGGKLFFGANDGTHGNELWTSDGSANGTVLVKDIWLGSGGGLRSYYRANAMTNIGGTVYFAADDGQTGTELWKSDGTPDGTAQVAEINGGALGSYPRQLTDIGGTLYFAANDGTHGFELWRSDGTSTGTALVKDVNPGIKNGVGYGYNGYYSYGANRFANAGGKLIFAADDGVHATELWTSDGTSDGTVEVKDINTGDLGSYPRRYANVGGTLYFIANDGTSGTALWKSDGTAGGTVLVKDINTVSNPYYLYYAGGNLTNVNGTLYFTAADGQTGTELWKSNGTADGTVEVKDINPGAPGSFPRSLTNVGGTLYFVANDGQTGNELWKSNGTADGTVQVKDINPGAGSGLLSSYFFGNGLLTNVGGTLYFVANDGSTGSELWKSDGTAAGTVQVKDINPGSGGSIGYRYYGFGRLTNVGGVLYFAASDGQTGTELWRSDGTSDGTMQVKDVNPGVAGAYPHDLTNVGGTVYFAANDGSTGVELWRSDGTGAGTVLVKDVNPGAASGVFTYGYGAYSGASFANVGGTLYFTATDGQTGAELWKSNGSFAGTVRVKDINPGGLGSYARDLTNVGGNLLFVANDGSTGAEVWQSDGTAAGTTLVKDIRPGSRGSIGYGGYRGNLRGTLLFAAEDGKAAYFGANDGATGSELWKATVSAVASAPVVSGVSPSSGPAAGGTTVTITGSGFTGASEVDFGGVSAQFTFNNDGQITATAPAGSGTVDITVTSPSGTSQTVQRDRFTYGPPVPAPSVTGVSPSSGPAAGGTAVTITGSGFTGATAVNFGTASASFRIVSDGQITATSPAGSGVVHITVTNPSGTSQKGQGDQFTYSQPPVVTPQSPSAPAVASQAPVAVASTSGGGAAFSGSVDPNGQLTTAHWEYGLDPSFRGPGFSGNVFDQSTPDQVVGADTSSHVFSTSVTNLIPNALYHVRLVATSAAGTTIGQDQTFTTPKAPAPPPPVLGRTENLAPVGKVFVKINGQFVPLTQAMQLPSGTVVDALHGSVVLTAAGGKGKSFTGTFGGAVFKVVQAAGGATKGLTSLDLIEGAFAGAPSYATCKAKPAGDPSASAARLSSRVLQTLHASEHGGRFRTVGRYSAATVRGTVWDTTDRCDGTLTTVHRGVVTVLDFVHHKTITLRAGHHYLAGVRKP